MEGEDEQLVFPTNVGTPVKALDHSMRVVCKEMGLAEDNRLTPHDLRRSFATTVTSLGYGRDAMDRILGHKDGRVRDVYDRFQYQHEARVIQEHVAKVFMGIINGQNGIR